ncbi:MAG: sigma-70 family RNA polymerase sigma factor [Deltaproteobacteria bacterium]|nr:MAG: sigma-70 family RNA polymerase sigma factor [Deltaproteobacteria bacterium]
MDHTFESYYHEYEVFVRVLCASRTTNPVDADELMALVWFDVSRQFQELKHMEPRQMLARLVRWRAYDWFRARAASRLVAVGEEALLDLLAWDAQQSLGLDARLSLEQALAAEEPKDRAILVGRYVEEQTWEELAEQLHMHRNTVHRRAMAALKRMRQRLQEPVEGEEES